MDRSIGGFSHGQRLRNPIDGRTRAKHKILYAVLLHQEAQIKGTRDIVLVILQRFGNGLTHGFERGKVDHRIKLVIGKHFVQRIRVTQVNLVECDRLASQLLNAPQRFF